ncbi:MULTISPECIES: 4-hydroxy-2-oxovalerate aldolase [unclassified Haladaptatus]|uniref:4-hydroxy-2-oxovalerate aldolase n=1 Tax=unclassified Haladaptatus TaxID=2622732 RepID=UPI00209C199A|nr:MULTISPECIES: 4-hydroxy-2-oxovalerate aldolase [unclassified Haladaptatus]MCO8243651.1 4-hydroxy-2-oxovalerate aldolase [Haladaptatus sp. AB643]MCO8255060.1 4-hydroxy-2-oxovalerate aldolase [Haladaptatus sp. AB618]
MTDSDVRLVDMTLRDGMHAVDHQFSPEGMADVARALNDANMDVVEMSHGDGMGGSSINYGFASASTETYLDAVVPELTDSELSVLLLPGIGTREHIEVAASKGADICRIATHVTEADISAQHFELVKDQGMEADGLLMLSHMAPPETVLEQARLMEEYGADTVYVMDSAGALLPSDVRDRVGLLTDELSIDVGFHAHDNLGLGIGNTLAALEEGVTTVDGCLRGLGAGAGNAQIEVLVGVLRKAGYDINPDLYGVMDAAEDVLVPMLSDDTMPEIDNDTLILGYAGVYSSFLRHTRRASDRYDLDPRDVLVELGEMGVVGGQEDLITDVAARMGNGGGSETDAEAESDD